MAERGELTGLRLVAIGAVYCAVGLVIPVLAGDASGRTLFLWRLSAFVICGIVFAAHIGYERLRLGRTLRSTARRAAAAVAIGAFGLALAANVHELGSATGYRPRMLVALVAWPLVTGAPALVVAAVAVAGLGLFHRGGSTRSGDSAV